MAKMLTARSTIIRGRGSQLRWNEVGECVCYVNTEIHKEWKARSTIRARRRQTKEDAFIAVVGSKRPNRLEADVFAHMAESGKTVSKDRGRA